jgi:hypothetical protein
MTRSVTTLALLSGLALLLATCGGRTTGGSDPIAGDIARWKRYLAGDTVSVGFVAQVKAAIGPAVTSADDALAKGRRAVALLRLANVRTNAEPVLRVPPTPTYEQFDAEHAKLAPRFTPAATKARAQPANTSALGRALAQSSVMQARETFDASDAYGRATEPFFGVFYLEQAVSWLDYASFAADAGASLRPAGARAPALRSIAPEIRALRDEMLAAYRPPLSIDRHPEYIGASSATKEALEYDAAGLHEAALLRYLQAAVRFAPLRPGPAPLGAATLAAKTGEWRTRLAAPGVDNSIGELFLELAAADADTARAGHAVVASAIVEDVLPRYFAALAPAAPAAAAKPPEVTVTLVRWPYT